MWVSIPLVALTLSLLTAAVGLISWFVARQVRRDRALTETVPQLQAVTFGPTDPATKLPKREEGLIARVEELERTVEDVKKYARRNRRLVERTQAVVVDILTEARDSQALNTGQFRTLTGRLSELDDPGDSEPPESDK